MRTIFHFLSTYTATILLLIIYAVAMAVATIVENRHGTEFVMRFFYLSPTFIFLQFLLVVNTVLITIQRHFIQRKKWAYLVIHGAFIIILVGAMTTHVFGYEGQVHIREGEKTNQMVMHTSRGMFFHDLPFTLELVEFRLLRHPGSQAPAGSESDLRIHLENEIREVTVSLNNVLDLKGYRFFQASRDDDEMGTFLSVNNDVAGRTITYIGYALLILGFIMMFFVRNSLYNKLVQDLREVRQAMKNAAVLGLFLLFSIPAFAQHSAMPLNEMKEVVQQNAVCPEHAAKFGQLPIQWRGRTMPMNTFSSEALRSLHRSTTFGKLNSDQFLLSLFAMPQMWKQAPLIAIPSREISYRFNLPEGHASFLNFFDMQGYYRLVSEVERIQNLPASERTARDRSILTLDERVWVVHILAGHLVPAIFPNRNSPLPTWYAAGDDLSAFREEDASFITRTFTWYLNEVQHAIRSGNWDTANNVLRIIKTYQLENCDANLINPSRLRAEVRYNELRIFRTAQLGYMLLGALLLIVAFAQIFFGWKWLNIIARVLGIGILFVFLYHAFGMGFRWYISGHEAPWSNAYETMIYVSWVTLLAGLIYGRKNSMLLALATLFGGVILFVASLNWMNPQISVIKPILHSPWLLYHVSTNVAAYGFFGVSFLLGIVNLLVMTFASHKPLTYYKVKELTIINHMSLLVGLALMTIGAFIGGVWANESWGRYWGWDPKETWALITIVVYTIVTHLYLVNKKKSYTWLFNLLSSLSFSVVLMTYMGVNFLLSGLHSYGQTADNMPLILTYIAFVFVAIGVLGGIAYRKGVNLEESGERRSQ